MDRKALFGIYERVWRETEEAGAYVVYRGMGNTGGEAGWFDPRFDEETGEPSPEVAVFRPFAGPNSSPSPDRIPGAPLPPPDLEAELHTLAHEAGHFESFRTRGDDWRAYYAAAIARDQVIARVEPEPSVDFALRARAAVRAQLTEAHRMLIVGEEQTAWDFGRELLRAAGLKDFSRYEESARRGVHFHRHRLGLDELWPDDEP